MLQKKNHKEIELRLQNSSNFLKGGEIENSKENL